MPTGVDEPLAEPLVRHLQGVHAVKAGALRMFDPMLAAVAAERDGEGLPEVTDLLTRQLASRAGDAAMAEVARARPADDEEQAATISRNFTNVLALMLASRGLPTLRSPEEDA
jgi:hypothetical protein